MIFDYLLYVRAYTKRFIRRLKNRTYYKTLKIINADDYKNIIFVGRLTDHPNLLSPFAYYKATKEREKWIKAARILATKHKEASHAEYKAKYGMHYSYETIRVEKPLFEFCFKINNLTKDKQ